MRFIDAISRLPLLVALLLPPATGVSQTGDNSQQSRTVSGQVVNSVTGQPIAGALVQIGGEHAMLTDHEGQFEFHDVAANWGAAATKPGYFSEQPAFVSLSMPAHEVHGAMILKLVPEAVIFGKALDPSSQPLQGLRVQLKRLEIRDGLRHWQQMESTTTNVEGEFRFFELQAGKYFLSTSFQVDGQPDQPSAVAYSPVVYPPPKAPSLGGPSSSGNEGFSVAAGDRVEANLNPPSQTLYPVTGHIEGPADQGVVFEAESSSGEIIRPVVRFTRFSGNFRLLLPSGSYHLKVRAVFQGELLFATREISLGEAPLKNISITPAPLAIMPVEIEYQAGSAPSPEMQPPPPLMANLGLEETDSSGRDRTFSPQPQSNSPGGSLAIPGLEPGEYRLVARPPPPWYLASAVCGALDLRRDPMTIAGSAAGCTIHAVLRNDSATLNWSVNAKSQGSSGKQIFVYALPLDNFIQSINMASAQQQGSGDVQEGSLEGLAPGRYLVMALDHAEELPYREPDLMQRYLSEGKEITLTVNAKSEVQLDVVTGGP